MTCSSCVYQIESTIIKTEGKEYFVLEMKDDIKTIVGTVHDIYTVFLPQDFNFFFKSLLFLWYIFYNFFRLS